MKQALKQHKQYLLTGVSYVIPMIACGGILIATSIALLTFLYPHAMTPTGGPDFSQAPTLKTILDGDEGARRLGEVSIVPHGSAISQSGRLFYKTLIDENASNHLALGRGFPFCIEGTEGRPEEYARRGGNMSMVHEDFMTGSGQLSIDGIREDGSREALTRDGEWAFDV